METPFPEDPSTGGAPEKGCGVWGGGAVTGSVSLLSGGSASAAPRATCLSGSRALGRHLIKVSTHRTQGLSLGNKAPERTNS